MSEQQARKYVDVMASDIRRISEILVDRQLINSLDPLAVAAAQCAARPYRPRGSTDFHWNYEIINLEFIDVSAECLRHSVPTNARKVFVRLSATVSGIYLPAFATDDPLISLGINIVVSGKDDEDNDIICAWHLDKHIMKTGDNTPLFVHPLYHFQYGGHELMGLNNGSHLLLDSPRLPHFPLDGILAIDFVLSNYYGEHWTNLKSEAEYQKMIENAQKRLWRPYSLSIASKWIRQDPSISDWDYRDILPQLVNN